MLNLDGACNIDIYQVTRRIWERDVYVHSDELPLVRVLGNESIFPDMRLCKFADFKDKENHDGGKRKQRNDSSNNSRLCVFWRDFPEVVKVFELSHFVYNIFSESVKMTERQRDPARREPFKQMVMVTSPTDDFV